MKRLVRVVRRLAVHELRGFHSLALWVARRRHGLGAGARPAAYTGPQTAMLFGFAFVAVVETVVLALIVPWPLVHSALLFVDLYTVLQILALHAASVTRPHVAGADGSLRVEERVARESRCAARHIDSMPRLFHVEH